MLVSYLNGFAVRAALAAFAAIVPIILTYVPARCVVAAAVIKHGQGHQIEHRAELEVLEPVDRMPRAAVEPAQPCEVGAVDRWVGESGSRPVPVGVHSAIAGVTDRRG
jgi:hypothetical protein